MWGGYTRGIVDAAENAISGIRFGRYSNFHIDFLPSTHQEEEEVEEEERQPAQMKIEMRKYKEKDK